MKPGKRKDPKAVSASTPSDFKKLSEGDLAASPAAPTKARVFKSMKRASLKHLRSISDFASHAFHHEAESSFSDTALSHHRHRLHSLPALVPVFLVRGLSRPTSHSTLGSDALNTDMTLDVHSHGSDPQEPEAGQTNLGSASPREGLDMLPASASLEHSELAAAPSRPSCDTQALPAQTPPIEVTVSAQKDIPELCDPSVNSPTHTPAISGDGDKNVTPLVIDSISEERVAPSAGAALFHPDAIPPPVAARPSSCSRDPKVVPAPLPPPGENHGLGLAEDNMMPYLLEELVIPVLSGSHPLSVYLTTGLYEDIWNVWKLNAVRRRISLLTWWLREVF